MVITIDKEDTPEVIAQKLEANRRDPKPVMRKQSIAHLCGAVKWAEDAVAYQKRLRDEWE